MGAASSLASHFSLPRLDGVRSAPLGHRNEYSIEYYYRPGKRSKTEHGNTSKSSGLVSMGHMKHTICLLQSYPPSPVLSSLEA